MKKKSGKRKPSRARAIKDLPVSDAKARQAKGGIGNFVKPFVKAALPTVP